LKQSFIALTPGVEGAIVGDSRGVSISGGNEDDHFPGKRTQNLFRNFLGDRVAVAKLSVVAWRKQRIKIIVISLLKVKQ
jgi:hypothetical protein